jgi:thioredoxin-like negative regulator of GroEL
MRHSLRPFRSLLVVVLATLFFAATTSLATAQVARASGIVKDASGLPIKGATIRAENPDASLSTITAATDDKGRFAIIGLARGEWSFTAEAPGYQPQFVELNIVRTATPTPPMTFTLQKAIVRPPAGVEGVTAKELQQQLASAEALYTQRKFQEAIGVYRTILTNAPSLTVVTLQIGAAYRNLKDYDKAAAAYEELLSAEPDNSRASIGLAMTKLEKGDAQAAEQVLTRAAEAGTVNRDLFYSLAEIKAARNQPEEAAKWYQKAADADASWGKPRYKLGTMAMSKGDKETAMKAMSQVIAIDPLSPEAAQAKTALEQLQR